MVIKTDAGEIELQVQGEKQGRHPPAQRRDPGGALDLVRGLGRRELHRAQHTRTHECPIHL